jgi:hypothetical protein
MIAKTAVTGVRARRMVLALLLATLMFAEKTPTACKGPPGDTGGGDWRVASGH